MIAALTGGTGFVGGAVLNALHARGHSVRALTRRGQRARDGVEWIEGALADTAALAELCRGADVVIHVAGAVNAPDRSAFDTANLHGTEAILAAAVAGGIRRFVHVSSLAAREPGLSAYGASKAAAERAVATSGLDWTIVRPPVIYGPGELLDLFRMAARGFVALPPAGGRASVIGVDDLARLLVILSEGDAGIGQTYEVDDGTPGGWDHRDLARAIGTAVGRKARPLSLSRMALLAASSMDRLIRGKRAQLTRDRVGYFCHPDWTVDPQLRPPGALWTPATRTSDGLAAAARAYRAAGLI